MQCWGTAFSDAPVWEDRAGHRHTHHHHPQPCHRVGPEGGGMAGRASWVSGNCIWNSVVQIMGGGLKPQGKWVLGRGENGGHHPNFVDSKLRLRELCHYQLVSDQTSLGTQVLMHLSYSDSSKVQRKPPPPCTPGARSAHNSACKFQPSIF